MPLSDALLADLLACAAGAASFEPASPQYLAAMTGTDTPVELTSVTDPGYARLSFTPGTAMILVSGNWQNVSDLVWGANSSDADWPDEVDAIYCYDADTDGDLLWTFVLAEGVVVVAGAALRVPAGDLIVEWPTS